MKTVQKYELGQIVRVKENLISGNIYGNEERTNSGYFYNRMEKFKGKFGVVVAYEKKGYVLRFGVTVDEKSLYYDEMLEEFVDLLKDSNEVARDAHRLIEQLELHNIQKCIDNALENMMHINDKENFQKLVDMYNGMNKK